jgi:hypothetical protein
LSIGQPNTGIGQPNTAIGRPNTVTRGPSPPPQPKLEPNGR